MNSNARQSAVHQRVYESGSYSKVEEPKRETVTILKEEEEKGNSLESSNARQSAIHQRVYESSSYQKMD